MLIKQRLVGFGKSTEAGEFCEWHESKTEDGNLWIQGELSSKGYHGRVITIKNGDITIGNYKHSEMHGKFFEINSCGHTMEGQFKDGEGVGSMKIVQGEETIMVDESGQATVI